MVTGTVTVIVTGTVMAMVIKVIGRRVNNALFLDLSGKDMRFSGNGIKDTSLSYSIIFLPIILYISNL